MKPCNVYCSPYIPERRIEDPHPVRECKRDKLIKMKKKTQAKQDNDFSNYAWFALAIAVALLLFNKRFKNTNFNTNRNGR